MDNTRAASTGDPGAEARLVRHLTPTQKAAVVMRLLLTEGAAPSLAGLPVELQERLATTMARMGHVDRATMAATLRDFTRALDGFGVAFPGDLDGAARLLGDRLSEPAARRLAARAGAGDDAAPWARLAQRPAADLAPILADESAEVAAILLSKLPPATAGALLGDLPPDRAEIVAYAMALTADIGPEAVERIGEALAERVDAVPPTAFDTPAPGRIGAILNAARGQIRDMLVDALAARDADLGTAVRKAIFTIEDIPHRIDARDVPALMRAVDPAEAPRALAAMLRDAPIAAEFLLENMSRRLAEQMREEAEAAAPPPEAEAEAAMAVIITAIREEQAAGRLTLLPDPRAPA